MSETALDRLASHCGILPEYWQIDGTHHPCGPDTKIALLGAMGIDAADEAAAGQALAEREHDEAGRPFPRVILLTAGTPTAFSRPDWVINLEEGGQLLPEPDTPEQIPPLPMGVHSLHAAGYRALVIASPPQAPSVADITGRSKSWGVWTSLYGLRSDRNAGVGDYEDLARLCEALAPGGAAFIGINPVHARGIAGTDPSPYSPSSRTTLDTRHIALDRIPGLDHAPEARALLGTLEADAAHARAATLVDRSVRDDAGAHILPRLFEAFENEGAAARVEAFEAWRARRDPGDVLQSVFEALSGRHGPDWRQWPPALRDSGSPEVEAFAHDNAPEIRFHDWCQWIAETQLAEAQQRAHRAGMPFGLYLDIAVGVRQGAAETWACREAFAQGVSLGAPPDQLNTQGQCWNLSGFSPPGLAADDYLPFRRMLRRTMALSGIVRIDHVIGLRRSFWVPDNGVPGGYVEFPTDTLLALIRIEAQRAGCLVVGEDLGTVPEGLRETLHTSGLLGFSIVPFERSGDGFADPAAHRARSQASFGTHDLPTLAGWWQGHEIELRTELGHYDHDTAAREQDARRHDRIALCRLLAAHGLLPHGIDPEAPPDQMSHDLADAVHALIARSAAELVAVGLDDIFTVTDQQNVPGTTDEVPNWRRRAPVTIEELPGSDDMARTARIMNEARPTAAGHEERTA